MAIEHFSYGEATFLANPGKPMYCGYVLSGSNVVAYLHRATKLEVCQEMADTPDRVQKLLEDSEIGLEEVDIPEKGIFTIERTKPARVTQWIAALEESNARERGDSTATWNIPAKFGIPTSLMAGGIDMITAMQNYSNPPNITPTEILPLKPRSQDLS